MQMDSVGMQAAPAMVLALLIRTLSLELSDIHQSDKNRN